MKPEHSRYRPLIQREKELVVGGKEPVQLLEYLQELELDPLEPKFDIQDL